MPFLIGHALNPGAGIRGQTLLGIGQLGGRHSELVRWGSGWAEGVSLSSGPLSVIGSLRFPWGRGAAAGIGLLPAGLEVVGSRF